MKIVYNEETKIFTLPIKVTHDTYNKTSNLVDILKNSNDRKELLKRGYDPSVKPTQRVVDNKVIKDTSESNGNPYVREYLNEDAVRKTSNDKILNDYINERNGTKADDPSNYQGLDESNQNTHIRIIKPGKGFDYHGYKQYPMGGHYFGDVKVGINGLNYTVGQDVKDGNSEVEFDLSTGDINDQMKIVNRKENILPLYNSVLDQLNEYKPSSVSYIPADNSDTLDEGNDKRRSNMNDRGHQRNELYKRKIKRFAPDSEVTNEGFLTYIDLNNPDWRKLATKSYSIVYNAETRSFSVYDNARDLAQLLSNSDTRKKLLEMGYDPSVNATNRVRDEESNKLIREYDSNDAVKKFKNDKILKKFLKEPEGFYGNNKRNIKSGNKHLVMYPSNYNQAGYDKDGNWDDGSFNYHGYKVEGYSPHNRNIEINGVKYDVGIGKDEPTKPHEVTFGTYVPGDEEYRSSKVVNKPENMKSLFNAISDQLSDVSPNKIRFNGAIGGDSKSEAVWDRAHKILKGEITPTDEEREFLEKHKGLHVTPDMIARGLTEDDVPKSWLKDLDRAKLKSKQREALYMRKIAQGLPGARLEPKKVGHQMTYNLRNAKWNKMRKNLGYK